MTHASPLSVRIDAATLDDVDGVARLLRQLWPDGDQDRAALGAILRRGLRSPDRRYLCARTDEGTLIGFCSLSIRESLWQAGLLAHVDELIVDAGHRGQGVGRALLKAIVRLANDAGCKRIELDSAPHRTSAHALYDSEEFERRAWLFSRRLPRTST